MCEVYLLFQLMPTLSLKTMDGLFPSFAVEAVLVWMVLWKPLQLFVSLWK